MTGDARDDGWRTVPDVPALADDEVHVWRGALAPPAAEVEAAAATLDAPERARAARFHFARDRIAFTVVRGALRALLGRYLGRPAAAIALEVAARGKPHLTGADAALAFNVSHSGGFGLLAFARRRALGVDVEQRRAIDDLDGLARHAFSPAEHAAWRALPADDRPAAFFRCWSRKEAFIKATGEGVAQLEAFDVELRPGRPPALLRTPDPPGRWQLRDLPALPDHASALVVEGHVARVACMAWPPSPV
jgi:4'-phosphopantetheinyl transferase